MTESVRLTVTGMKCGGCEANVKNRLGSIDGVLTVNASSKDKLVEVEFDSAKIRLDVIKAAIAEVGFTVE
ncbi:MAG: heavy-metal-associated domain-containing protein [Gammaproteobacteria bacterium]